MMTPVVRALIASAVSLCRSGLALQWEILALQHQRMLSHRAIWRPPVRPSDRLLWSWGSRGWPRGREARVFGLTRERREQTLEPSAWQVLGVRNIR